MARNQDTSSFETTIARHDGNSDFQPRFEAPDILLRHGISCVVWGEDALWHYGVPTVCFDLFLLIEDPETAVQCLENVGYRQTPPIPRYEEYPELCELPLLKKRSTGEVEDMQDVGTVYVVFVRAQQVHYILPPVDTIKDLIPPLPALMDSIIDAWLDATSLSYLMHLGTRLSYLHSHCPDAHDRKLVSELKPGHREFFLRYVSDSRGVKQEREAWRRVRDSFLSAT